MTRLSKSLLVATFVGFMGFASPVCAAWPDRPVTFVVPNPAGGSTDVLARYLAQHLTTKLGANFLIENRAGASGAIGAASVARAEPDGYTFLFGTTGQLASIQYLGVARTYDPEKDLEPVIHVANAPIAVIINSELPVNNMKEFMDYVRNNPGKLSYGTPGVATTSHIGGEWFKHLTKLNIIHVPYRGSGPVTNDLVASHIKLAFDSPVSNLQHIRSGKLKALAVTGDNEFEGLPGVPTLKASGVDMQIVLLFGIASPKGVPTEIIQRLSKAVDEILQLKQTKDQLLNLGAEGVGGTPESFGKFLVDERARWRVMIETTGIQSGSK